MYKRQIVGSYMIFFQIDTWYVFIRRNGRLGKNDKNEKAPAVGRRRKHGTCRVGRGEQGEARPAMSALRGGPHLDLGRLRLKTWSKSDFSIAETTGRTYLYKYL